MKKQIVSTPDAPRAIGPYSQAVVANGLVFASGQVGIDPKTGELVGGGTAAQATQALENLGAVLRAAGSSFDAVVKANLYLTDLGEFALVNEIYARFVGESFPARATVGVGALPKGASFEIEAVALVTSPAPVSGERT